MVVWLKKHPLHLAFRAREGGGHTSWWWSSVRCGCGSGVGCAVWRWAEGSRAELVVVVIAHRGEGVEGVCRESTHLLCQQRNYSPPSRILSEGGGGDGGVSTEKLHPSISPFKQGRGWRWWCVDRNYPLRLAFRARKGVVMVVVSQQM